MKIQVQKKKILKMIEEVIIDHPVQIQQYMNGKEQLLKFLIGMVMKISEGSADPMVVEKLFKKRLK